MNVRAVFFDVGETLVDESRMWGEWADWLGVPRFTFFAVLGAVIARGEFAGRLFLDSLRVQRQRGDTDAASTPNECRRNRWSHCE